jgi:hypothetical protein
MPTPQKAFVGPEKLGVRVQRAHHAVERGAGQVIVTRPGVADVVLLHQLHHLLEIADVAVAVAVRPPVRRPRPGGELRRAEPGHDGGSDEQKTFQPG